MVKLTVTSIGGRAFSNVSMLFDPTRMVYPKTSGSGTEFFYVDETGKADLVKVSQTLDQVAAMFSVDLGNASFFRTVGVFDATGGKSIATHNLVDLNGNTLTLPNKTRVMRAFYVVETTFTSATDAATISLGIATNDVAGIKAAIAISNGANPWDAGIAEGIQTGTAANASEITTAARTVDAVVAVEALTAGKLRLFLDCITLI